MLGDVDAGDAPGTYWVEPAILASPADLVEVSKDAPAKPRQLTAAESVAAADAALAASRVPFGPAAPAAAPSSNAMLLGAGVVAALVFAAPRRGRRRRSRR
jgi:hypothetical protein